MTTSTQLSHMFYAMMAGYKKQYKYTKSSKKLKVNSVLSFQ